MATTGLGTMRGLTVRVGVATLAAVGAKSLWDRYGAPTQAALRSKLGEYYPAEALPVGDTGPAGVSLQLE